MSSGALGQGSYRSAIAGTRTGRFQSYYGSSYELLQLHRAHQEVVRHFLVRDKVFDNKFPGCALANGLFKFVPNRREGYHMKEVMESIRRRSIWMQRIYQQRAINAAVIEEASKKLSPDQLENYFSYKTADSDAYFSPAKYTAANTWPNYWQHPTQIHVVPQPKWLRVADLGGITRVQEPLAVQPMDY